MINPSIIDGLVINNLSASLVRSIQTIDNPESLGSVTQYVTNYDDVNNVRDWCHRAIICGVPS